MNERKRFIQTMTAGNPDHPSYGDYFCYDSTRLRWEKEGMPKDINLFRHFGFDHIRYYRDLIRMNAKIKGGDVYD